MNDYNIIHFYVICLYIVKNQMSTSEQWIYILDSKYYSIPFFEHFNFGFE